MGTTTSVRPSAARDREVDGAVRGTAPSPHEVLERFVHARLEQELGPSPARHRRPCDVDVLRVLAWRWSDHPDFPADLA